MTDTKKALPHIRCEECKQKDLMGYYVATKELRDYITICRLAFRSGVETIAAFIVHETAHWCSNRRGVAGHKDPFGFGEAYWVMSRCFPERFGHYFGGQPRPEE